MNIGIIGIGGIGSLIASRLSTTNHKIFCFGSKKSNNHIKKNGISFKSKFYGDNKFFPEKNNQLNRLDILFISVKGTQLSSSLSHYKDFFQDNTVAVSLLNGFDYRKIIRDTFNMKLIVGSIGSVEIYLNKEREAIHKSNNKPIIEIATSERDLKKEITLINNTLKDIGLDSKILDDENMVIWKKLSRLSVIATVTSMHDSSIGEVCANNATKKIILQLIDEICQITFKIGLNINPDEIFKTIKSLPYDLKTSMQRDINSNKASEIDFILKAPLKFGNELGLDLPVMKKCYEFLDNKINLGSINEKK